MQIVVGPVKQAAQRTEASGPTALQMFTRLKDQVTSTTERESALTSSAAAAGALSVWAVLSASKRA